MTTLRSDLSDDLARNRTFDISVDLLLSLQFYAGRPLVSVSVPESVSVSVFLSAIDSGYVCSLSPLSLLSSVSLSGGNFSCKCCLGSRKSTMA